MTRTVLEHTDFKLVNTHHWSMCQGRPCPVHNRTDHAMRSFPQHWRSDRALMERTCPHGVGHPDPDSPPWTDWTHGCDGCCAGAYREEPEQMVLLYECARCGGLKSGDEVRPVESDGMVREIVFVCRSCPEEER